MPIEYAFASGIPGRPGARGNDGADGNDGASAYDLARAGGYTGTETEFIALLAGIQNGSQTISALAALIVPENNGKVIGVVDGALAAVSGGAAYPDGDGVSY